MNDKQLTDEQKLAEAVDMLHVAREVMYQKAVLFRQIRNHLKDQHLFMDCRVMAEIGEREAEGWSSSFEALLVQFGEKLQ